MKTMQFDPKSPSYVFLNLMQEELEDETDLLKFGQVDHVSYQQLNIGQQLPSYWTDDLKSNPGGQYKFGSMHLTIDPDRKNTIRHAYGLLDLCGDIGGLLDGLIYLISFTFSPFWRFSFRSHMLTKLFRAEPDRETVQPQSDQLS